MGNFGAQAPNLHEGGRSEYYALLALSSLGFCGARATPGRWRVEICIVLFTEGDSRRAWAYAYYVVQVKSDEKPWEIIGERSVEALIKVPLPLFLCVVQKKQQRLRVYHTSPQFYLWTFPPYPARVHLIPGEPGNGVCTQWQGGERFNPSADPRVWHPGDRGDWIS